MWNVLMSVGTLKTLLPLSLEMRTHLQPAASEQPVMSALAFASWASKCFYCSLSKLILHPSLCFYSYASCSLSGLLVSLLNPESTSRFLDLHRDGCQPAFGHRSLLFLHPQRGCNKVNFLLQIPNLLYDTGKGFSGGSWDQSGFQKAFSAHSHFSFGIIKFV